MQSHRPRLLDEFVIYLEDFVRFSGSFFVVAETPCYDNENTVGSCKFSLLEQLKDASGTELFVISILPEICMY